jgi:hypothetical protein
LRKGTMSGMRTVDPTHSLTLSFHTVNAPASLRIAVLAASQLRFFGCAEYEQAYRWTLDTLSAEEGMSS